MVNSFWARLFAGRAVFDTQFDPDNIPSSDQKAALAGTDGTPSAANKLITASDPRVPTQAENDALAGPAGHTPSGTNPLAPKSYVDNAIDGLDWQESVLHSIDYRKAGAPNGTFATNGEKCLNTTGNLLHTFTASIWDAGVAVSVSDRFIHKDTGTDTTGAAGTHTKDNKIRQYVGSGVYTEITPDKATVVNVEDENAEYVFDATNWLLKASSTNHNGLSGLQGGVATEYYHLKQSDYDGVVNAPTVLSSTNPVMSKADRDMVAHPYKFIYFAGFPAGQTDVVVYERDGNFQEILMPKNGSIVASTLQCDGPRLAGTLTAEPTIVGVEAGNGLDLTLDGITVNDAKATTNPGTAGLTFTAGQKIGAHLTSDALWSPITSTIEYTLWVVFDN